MANIYGTDADDSITSIDPANNLDGAEDDVLDGGIGKDTMTGGLGNDTYYVDHIYDRIIENDLEGIDTAITSTSYMIGDNVENLTLSGMDDIYGIGNELNNIITGNTGNNLLDGDIGDDAYIGGMGNDTIYDMSGNETYTFNTGDGQDVIYDYEGTDTVKFGEGITKDSLEFLQDGNNLVVTIKGTTDKITIMDWYTDLTYKIEKLEFFDSTYMTAEEIDQPKPTILGTDKKNVLNGTKGNDFIHGMGGNDQIFDKKGGDDTLYGGDGKDKIMDKIGNDLIDGGTGNDNIQDFKGNDTIIGGIGNDALKDYAGSDIYMFNTGDGKDKIYDMGKGKQDVDKIVFGAEVTKENIVFFKKGNDLIISYGAGDTITIKNQTKKGIEYFELSTGELLTDTDVTRIVQDMAAYSKEQRVSFKTIESVTMNTDMMTMIASSWHS